MKARQRQGLPVEPVVLTNRRDIATTFWGNGWCKHIESLPGFGYRLPKGRTYVRNGSVCHLGISSGNIDAIISGNGLYKVRIRMAPLAPKSWEALKTACAGHIGSVLDLLNGQLSEATMSLVCHPSQGLFPTASEMRLSCNCPDWTKVCKHLTAVLYGVGARLDTNPAALFLLRGVDYTELIDLAPKLDTTGGKRQRLDTQALSDVFNIQLAPQKADP
jgi:uncharacterized Zn finger protein